MKIYQIIKSIKKDIFSSNFSKKLSKPFNLNKKKKKYAIISEKVRKDLIARIESKKVTIKQVKKLISH